MCDRNACILPSARTLLLRSLLVALAWVLAAHPAQAQQGARPLFDGLTVAPGLSMYIGDLDGNPDSNPIAYFAAGQFGLMVAADRRFGNVSAGLELHYNRMKVDRGGFKLSNNIISLDLVGGYHFDLIRSDLFRLVGGVGVTLLAPSYDRFPDHIAVDDRAGTRVLLTFPVSVSFQDRVRVGLRLTTTDFLDGFGGQDGGGDRDLISFVNVGYRFNFAN